jgi:hypothetical protein
LSSSSDTPLDQRSVEEQRAVLTSRIGRDGVAAIERGEILDSAQGRRVVHLPTSETPGPRSARVVRNRGFVAGVDLGEGVIDVTDTQTSGDAIAAREDDRAADRRGEVTPSTGAGVYSGIAEVMRKRVAGRTRNDRVGRAKPLTGQSQQALYEQLNRDDGPKRKKSEMRAGRVSPEVAAAIDASGIAPGAILESFGRAMLRSGASAETVQRSLETGVFDPDLVDAIEHPPTPLTNSTAA